jgi:hypothetical protein
MKNISLVLLFIGFSIFANASNLNVGASTYNDTDKTLSFTISWDYSWRLATGPSNWDAVWIFIKRQNCNVGSTNQVWAHQLLSTKGDDEIDDEDVSDNPFNFQNQHEMTSKFVPNHF